MAPKKRSRKPAPAPSQAGQSGNKPEAEGVPVVHADTDVERADSKPPAGIASVEAADPAGRRVDIEHGGVPDPGDIERGPA